MEAAALINMMNYSLKTADEVIKFVVNKRFQHIHHWRMEVRKSQGLKYHRTEIILYNKACIYNLSKSTEINWKLYDSKVKFGLKIIWQCPYILFIKEPDHRSPSWAGVLFIPQLSIKPNWKWRHRRSTDWSSSRNSHGPKEKRKLLGSFHHHTALWKLFPSEEFGFSVCK